MKSNHVTPSPSPSRLFSYFLLLFILVGTTYSNSLNNEWQFDDRANIVENESVHLTEITKTNLITACSFDKLNRRPLAYLSFALNWYFGHDLTTSYHAINILLHACNAFLLFLIILKIFQSPRLRDESKNRLQYIALFSALLWAVNPIQTQAVNLIVQRMTLLSAFFYLFSIVFYLQARLTVDKKTQIRNISFCLLSFFLGLGSKENIILLPGGLFLVEILFFKDLGDTTVRRKLYTFSLVILALAVGTIAFFLLFKPDFISPFLNFSGRTFTLSERILTEQRIVPFYLSQIFYPDGARLSIDHDFLLSSSLFSPWTTLPSVLLNLGLCLYALKNLHKAPLIALAILFYFYNHLLESTIIPLELVFEHRNYLPSVFLFLPIVAFVCHKITQRKSWSTHWLAWNSILFATILISALASYQRNSVWKTEKSIWLDAIEKSPNLSRPYVNLGYYLHSRNQNIPFVMELYKIALEKKSQTPRRTKFRTYNNLGDIYAKRYKDYDKAIFYYKQAITLNSKKYLTHKKLATVLVHNGQIELAIAEIELLLQRGKKQSTYGKEQELRELRIAELQLITILYLKKQNSQQALVYLTEAEQLDDKNMITLLQSGFIQYKLGNYEEADKNLQLSLASVQTNKPMTLMALIENNVQWGKTEAAKAHVQQLITLLPAPQIYQILATAKQTNNVLLPVSQRIIQPLINEALQTF